MMRYLLRPADHSAVAPIRRIWRAAWPVLILAALAVAGGLLSSGGGVARPVDAHSNASVATAISIVSSGRAGAEFVTGEEIIVRVVFDQAVYSYGIGAGFVPRLAIDIGGTICAATPPAAVPNSATVDFSCTVASTHTDNDGITVARTALYGTLGHRHTPTGATENTY